MSMEIASCSFVRPMSPLAMGVHFSSGFRIPGPRLGEDMTKGLCDMDPIRSLWIVTAKKEP